MILPPKIEHITRPYMIDKAINNTRKYDVFHPSAWGSCLRKVAYQYYNEKEKFYTKEAIDIDIKQERVYDNGHGMHARWQKYLDCAGVLRGCWKCQNPTCGKVYGREELLGIFNPLRTPGWACKCGNASSMVYEELLIKSDPTYNFEGHCDAVADLRGTQFATNSQYDLVVIDFKTMKNEYFFDLDQAKYEHVVQTHIYMWVLGLAGAVILYENKDNQNIKEMFVPRDEAIIEKVKEEAIWMKDVVLEKRKLPQRPDGFTASKIPCRFCEFAKLCYK